MIDLVIITVAAFACSWVIADSRLSLPFREALDTMKHKKVFGAALLLTFVECVACTGAWIGMLAYFSGATSFLFSSWWMAGLYTCGANLLLAKYVGMLDEDSG